MVEGININVQSPTIEAPVSVDFSGVSVLDSMRNGINDLVDNIKSGSDEALTTVFIGVMFFVVGLHFWRRV